MNIPIEQIREYFRDRKPGLPADRNLIRAGVLIPLLERNGELHVILTKRTDEVEHHKGQISFPGGAKDESDGSIIDTALRETEEEIGVGKNLFELLGTLNDFCTPSGFCITPVVGFLRSLPRFKINSAEVSEVFDVPLSFFLDPHNERVERREIKGAFRDIYYYNYGGYEIWGATAAIIHSFLHDLIR